MKSQTQKISHSDRGGRNDSLAEFCFPGSTWNERMIELSSGISLRVVTFFPESKTQSMPVVMAPGLASVMLTFKNVLIELTRHFVVHYVETREKSSSIVPGQMNYDVKTIGLDIIEIISLLNSRDREYILFAASLSASAAIECSRHFIQKPCCLILLEPNAVFDYPRWSFPVIRYMAPVYTYLRAIVKWYIKNFRINAKEDYEMYRITSRALDAADPYKLRDTVLAISTYEIWDRLDDVDVPTLIVCASKDIFHRYDDIRRIVSGIKNCTYRDLVVHERTHSKEFVDLIRDYTKTIEQERTKPSLRLSS